MKQHRPQNSDVGDFINNKLREIDNDPVQPPYDSLQEYAYEGEGSMFGSTLSELDVSLDPDINKKSHHPNQETTPNNKQNQNHKLSKKKQNGSLDELDIEGIKSWGPKFNKLSNIYGGVKSEDEENN
jgi:hypothetical protein